LTASATRSLIIAAIGPGTLSSPHSGHAGHDDLKAIAIKMQIADFRSHR
jgi:hypothetical protein